MFNLFFQALELDYGRLNEPASGSTGRWAGLLFLFLIFKLFHFSICFCKTSSLGLVSGRLYGVVEFFDDHFRTSSRIDTSGVLELLELAIPTWNSYI